MIPSFDASYERNELYESHVPYDLSSGTSTIFVYNDIFQYQTVGDARVIDSNRCIKNGSACSIEPNHRKNFTNLDYKKLFITLVQSISVHLCTETGRLVPFAGTGKVVLILKFKRFDWMWRFGCWYWSCCYTVCTTDYSTDCEKIGQRTFDECSARTD